MRRVLFVLLPCLTLASDPITIDSLFKRQIGLRSITTFSLLSSGKVIDKELGSSGFGYDFMFIPNGFDKTVGQLDESIKLEISHRSKGLRLAKPVLKVLSRYY